MLVQDLLSERKRWTVLSCFRDVAGTPCDEANAVAYCLLGALSHCYPDKEDYYQATGRLQYYLGGSTISGYNDSHTYEEVLDIARKANI